MIGCGEVSRGACHAHAHVCASGFPGRRPRRQRAPRRSREEHAKYKLLILHALFRSSALSPTKFRRLVALVCPEITPSELHRLMQELAQEGLSMTDTRGRVDLNLAKYRARRRPLFTHSRLGDEAQKTFEVCTLQRVAHLKLAAQLLHSTASQTSTHDDTRMAYSASVARAVRSLSNLNVIGDIGGAFSTLGKGIEKEGSEAIGDVTKAANSVAKFVTGAANSVAAVAEGLANDVAGSATEAVADIASSTTPLADKVDLEKGLDAALRSAGAFCTHAWKAVSNEVNKGCEALGKTVCEDVCIASYCVGILVAGYFVYGACVALAATLAETLAVSGGAALAEEGSLDAVASGPADDMLTYIGAHVSPAIELTDAEWGIETTSDMLKRWASSLASPLWSATLGAALLVEGVVAATCASKRLQGRKVDFKGKTKT